MIKTPEPLRTSVFVYVCVCMCVGGGGGGGEGVWGRLVNRCVCLKACHQL